LAWCYPRDAKSLAENHRLKKLVADLSLDKDMLKSVIAKNVWSAAGLQEQIG
jgi:hypothetical protein